MKRFLEGADRGQSTLLPQCLDDWIDEGKASVAIDGSKFKAINNRDRNFTRGKMACPTGRYQV